MKTYKQSGNMLSVISPYVVGQGDGVLVGGLFGIATLSCQAGQALEIICQGVFSVAKTTPETWAVGDKAYWNNTTKKFTTSASGALLVGLVSEVAASLGVVGSVLLTQQPGLVDATVNAVTGGIANIKASGRSVFDDMGIRKQQFGPRQTIFPGVNTDVPTLALSGPGGSTPVATSVLKPYNTSSVRLVGCVPSYANALGTDYYTNIATGVGGSGATVCAVEFEGYFDDIAIVFRNAVVSKTSFWVWANDPSTGGWKPTTSGPVTVAAANANSQFYERVTFSALAQRQVRVYYFYADFGGIYVKPTQTIVATAPAARSLCVIADSYGGGALTVDQPMTWPNSLSRLLSTDLFLNSVGGTGYVSLNAGAGGNNNFSSAPRVTGAIASGATDFILAGSINDSSSLTVDVVSNATSLISQIKTSLPNSRIWMTGVQGLPVTASGTSAANNAALTTLAAANGIPFIDTFTNWYTGTGRSGTTTGDGNRDVFLGTDGVHPTQAGHDYIAARMYQELVRLGW